MCGWPDAALYLDGKASIAAYLTEVIDANDASLLAAALGDIARARGMTEIARSAGMTREPLTGRWLRGIESRGPRGCYDVNGR